MDNLKDKLKSLIIRTSLPLVLSTFLLGCEPPSQIKDYVSKESKKDEESPGRFVFKENRYNTNNNYSFTNFGYHYTKFSLNNIISGDFDGDGDIDIAGVNSLGKLIIYENKIPQKKLE